MLRDGVVEWTRGGTATKLAKLVALTSLIVNVSSPPFQSI